MAVLTDHQFELEGVVFGLDCPVFVAGDGFEPGGITWRTQRADSARSGSRRFGTDWQQATTWAWTMHVDEEREKEALATLTELALAWKARGIRRTPNKVVPLRYALGGRTRVIYGRPGNFGPAVNNTLLSGTATIVADFECADGVTYSDEEFGEILGITPASVGGVASPAKSPFSSMQTAAPLPGIITVGGDEPTPLTVRFDGPSVGSATGYKLDIDDGTLVVGYDNAIAYDQSVTVDPRPWMASVTRGSKDPNVFSEAVSVAGGLSVDTPTLVDVVLAPGQHVLRFTAADTSGTASCAVTWREASPSL